MKFPDAVIFASYGNDSVALIQWAYERRLGDVIVLYSDTGWAADEWTARLDRMEAWVRGLGFRPVRTESMGLEQLVKAKKGWPRQGMQFCTLDLKIRPAMDFLDRIDPFGVVHCYVGVRREESRNRAGFPLRVEISPNHGGRTVYAPLAELTSAERDALLARAGVDPLPHRSRECFPRINENRTGLREIPEERVAVVERIESELGFTSKGKPRTMFRPYRHMGAVGIRAVKRWADSARGEFDPDDDCEDAYCGI